MNIRFYDGSGETIIDVASKIKDEWDIRVEGLAILDNNIIAGAVDFDIIEEED